MKIFVYKILMSKTFFVPANDREEADKFMREHMKVKYESEIEAVFRKEIFLEVGKVLEIS